MFKQQQAMKNFRDYKFFSVIVLLVLLLQQKSPTFLTSTYQFPFMQIKCHSDLPSCLLCLEFWSFSLSDFIKGDLGSWDPSGQKSLHGFLTFKEA